MPCACCRALNRRRRRPPAPPAAAVAPNRRPPSSPPLTRGPRQAPAWKPDAYEPEAEPRKDAAWVEGRSAEELEELEDEFGDDRALEEFRWGWGRSSVCGERAGGKR